MTKKEELLLFINDNINETNKLRTVERIVIPSSEESFLKANDGGNKTYSIDKETLVKEITEHFDDDLIGGVSGDLNVSQILYWFTIAI